MSVEYKVDGFDDLFKQMDELKDEIGKAKTDKIWRNAMRYAFQPVLDKAKDLAPRDTGQLADHLYLKVQRPQGRDKSSKYYDGEVFMARVTLNPTREDTIQRTVLTKKGKFKNYNVNKPVGLSQEFGNARTAPHPFLRPALESSTQDVIDRLGRSIWSEMTWGKYAKKE
jgi:HK97 gp10 family phage protein